MTSLRDLSVSLPALTRAVSAGSPSAAFIADPEPVEGYVWPSLSDWDGVGAVLLIKAPGAVGKSAAARALASQLNWPVIDAAKAQVGSYSLTGLLHDVLGFDSGLIGEVATGRAGIVVDALDEAHLKAGTSNFLAFLENIQSLVSRAPGEHPSVVLFSRPDTAEFVSASFLQSEVQLREATIEYFDYRQACSFLESYIAGLRRANPGEVRYRVVEQHPAGYAALRDRRLAEIATAILGRAVISVEDVWPEVSTFLGYAPVLAVLAEVLAVPNPAVAQDDLLALQGASEQSVLARIVDELLQREQGKFLNQALPKLRATLSATAAWGEDADSYSAGEQAVRLVARYFGADIAVPPPAIIPESIRPAYEEAANQFIADHPFLNGREAVNVVFGDYILAKATVDPAIALHIDSRTLRTDGRRPGPFFYYFAHENAPPDAELGARVVDESLFQLLLESRTQAAGGTGANDFVVFAQMAGNASIRMGNALLRRDRDGLDFSIASPSGMLEVPRQLSRAVVITDAAVILGRPDETFILGPNAAIICDELYVEANRISVDAGGAVGVVTPSQLVAATDLQVRGSLTVDAPVPGSLVVQSAIPWPQLRPYMRPFDDAVKARDSWNDYMDLRAILISFRQGAGSAPSIYEEKLEQGIVKGNPTRRALLRSLLDGGFVYRANAHYYLDTANLSAVDVNLTTMVSGQRPKAVLELLQRLLPS